MPMFMLLFNVLYIEWNVAVFFCFFLANIFTLIILHDFCFYLYYVLGFFTFTFLYLVYSTDFFFDSTSMFFCSPFTFIITIFPSFYYAIILHYCVSITPPPVPYLPSCFIVFTFLFRFFLLLIFLVFTCIYYSVSCSCFSFTNSYYSFSCFC